MVRDRTCAAALVCSVAAWAAAAWSAAGWPGAAHAEPALADVTPGTAIRVAWTGNPECDDRALFDGELLAHVGDDARRAELDVSITIERTGDGEHALTLTTGVGTRTLIDPNCEELLKTAAFVLGMSVDTLAQPDGPVAVDQIVDRERIDGTFVGDEEPPDFAPPPPAPGPPVELTARAVAGGDLAMLPAPSAAVGAAAAVTVGELRLEAGASAWEQKTAVSAEDPMNGVDLSLWTVALRGCQQLVKTSGDIAIDACMGGELGRFRISTFGFGVVGEGATSAPWWAMTASTSVSVPLWRAFSLRADIGFVAPLVQPRFQFSSPDGGELLHRPGLVSARGFGGLEVKFR